MSAYDFAFTAIEGGALPLDRFRGQVLLVVNTASFCGLTPQYAGLEQLHSRYRDQGLVVLGVPANDFGAQEPGTEAEILQFCETRFHIDFPMAAKEKVVGPAAHPFYQWAKAQLGAAGTPQWNFHKLLVGRDGALAAGFGSAVKPGAPELVQAVEAALAR